MKHIKFGLFLAIFALVLVGCEKTDPVTQNTTTNKTTSSSTKLQVVNVTQYTAAVYFDAEYVIKCDPRDKDTYILGSEHIGTPLYVEVNYYDSDYDIKARGYWESVTFKNGHTYKMTLTGKGETTKLEMIE